jgi:pimeloyl-ACP methyl ester carboxylesterase
MRTSVLALAAAAVLAIAPSVHAADGLPATRNVVLLTGSADDGSDWRKVRDVMAQDGYTVTVVTASGRDLAGDVARTRDAIAAQAGPVLLAGYSGAGAVVSEAGNDPRVTGLVYIAADAPQANAAGKTRPIIYLVAGQDAPLTVEMQRTFAHRAGAVVVELSGPQPIYQSLPVTVAKVIEQGAQAGGVRQARELAETDARGR